MTRRGPQAPEKRAQLLSKRLYGAAGCVVFDTSQPFRAAITPGVPDLLVFHPARGAFWFHEVKAGKGALSPDQRRFQMLCGDCHIAHVVGDETAARHHLEAMGLILALGTHG